MTPDGLHPWYVEGLEWALFIALSVNDRVRWYLFRLEKDLRRRATRKERV